MNNTRKVPNLLILASICSCLFTGVVSADEKSDNDRTWKERLAAERESAIEKSMEEGITIEGVPARTGKPSSDRVDTEKVIPQTNNTSSQPSEAA